MDISVKINIILSVLSFVLALFSLVFVMLTLKQNNNMLYANSRPYLALYFAYEENNSELFLCIKNCGSASDIVKIADVFPELLLKDEPIGQTLANTLIAPNQQIHFGIRNKKELAEKGPYKFHAKLEYIDVNNPKKTIKEEYDLDIEYLNQVLHTEHRQSILNKTDNALYNIEKDIKAIALNNL